MIVQRHAGVVPEDLGALLALPGVGPCTARAVRSLAFGHDCGVLDCNAARVLARALVGRRLGRAEAQRLADSIVPPGRSRDWNQAVMDLGSGVCTRRARRVVDALVAEGLAELAGGVLRLPTS